MPEAPHPVFGYGTKAEWLKKQGKKVTPKKASSKPKKKR